MYSRRKIQKTKKQRSDGTDTSFFVTVKDELLPAKVLIKKALEAGVIGKKNDTYYLRQDGSPLCEMNEESTLNNAARYLSSVKHQDLKFLIEARVKDK